jgi:hypothetical protein
LAAAGQHWRYPTGEEQLRRWLTDYIAQAFHNVHLNDGMTIYTGESLDRYGDAEEDRKSMTAERYDWRRVPVPDLLKRHCSLSYLDADGFRFYTPAIMTIIVRDLDSHGMLTDSFLYSIHNIRSSCRVCDTPYCMLYNRSQRAAIIRFVKYLIHNVPGGGFDDAMWKTLVGLPRCCSETRKSE